MADDIRFDGQVAIVTGAGGGLGRQHALALARRGAKVVVNDLGGSVDGSGGSSDAAKAVVAEIEAAGGEAIAHGASVTDDAGVADMVKTTMESAGAGSTS
jgi:NAD(P)-dependent dehydrogenase (short-subunit alcohol dehydrogenase family)